MKFYKYSNDDTLLSLTRENAYNYKVGAPMSIIKRGINFTFINPYEELPVIQTWGIKPISINVDTFTLGELVSINNTHLKSSTLNNIQRLTYNGTIEFITDEKGWYVYSITGLPYVGAPTGLELISEPFLINANCVTPPYDPVGDFNYDDFSDDFF